MAIVQPHERGTVLSVWVVPGASRTEIAGVHGDAFRIRVTAPPDGGKANDAVIALLQEHLGTKVELLSGHSSRRKRVLVNGANPAAVLSSLQPEG